MAETPEAAGDAIAVRSEQLGANFARLLANVLKAADRALRPVLQDAIAGDRTATIRAARGVILRSDIRQALRDAGFDDLARTASEAAVEAMAVEVMKTRTAQGVAKMVKPSQQRIAALAALGEANLLGTAEDITTALVQAVSVWAFTVTDPNRILEVLADVTDTEFSKVQTLFDTQTSIYGRQIEAVATENLGPNQAFLYTGPVDGRTRDWCLDRVGKVYTRAEIERMDNGQLPNPFLTGGGYNCRHSFLAVASDELTALANTGQRAARYAGRIEQARALRAQARRADRQRRQRSRN
jgi:hypothetical protein